jgi:hypothetical protein
VGRLLNPGQSHLKKYFGTFSTVGISVQFGGSIHTSTFSKNKKELALLGRIAGLYSWLVVTADFERFERKSSLFESKILSNSARFFEGVSQLKPFE